MEYKKNIIFITIAIAFCITLSRNIYSSVESYKYRRLCNQYRESLIATEEENRELADRIGRVAEITGRIKKTADTNITDARSIIETVEQIRAEVYELENCLGCFDQLEYYQYWDNEFRDEQLMD